MSDRPYVTLSCAMSVDGHIDDLSDQRLLLSNDEDFDRVDAVRAENDAILVGANTIRRDDPRLLVRSEQRRDSRVNEGKSPHPVKVTLTESGDLNARSRFFTTGDTPKLVYAAAAVAEDTRKRLDGSATVIDVGERVNLKPLLSDVVERGVGRLMVEGGGRIHTRFLTEGVADEIHLVIAPFFVGEADAPRFVHPGSFPHTSDRRMELAEVRQIGDVVLLRYLAK
ncbi:5-amino-6-(5-phosphoribosylamino)uracil reductase [Nocardiopsis mwathae]|uniref:5-amino-6-(5-phosphoribosylamino)uracil reductase n=1 Tax=Nocardiopsis mwathae TaxID=1472723 RepID=A0A7X0D820_9ACTN|nr:dihydrofolate reductase family protein [Nocardiopsis mwathae]MBB6173584.1 5-amino-6-(5-phosphoribosylamino)uracil reductase [Nocardiopsis mwathae]